jgi:hypothetical protein
MDESLPNTIQQNHADKKADDEDNEWLDIPVADEDQEDTKTASGMECNNPASVVAVVAEGKQATKKRGREASSCWEHLNNQPNSQKMPVMQLHGSTSQEVRESNFSSQQLQTILASYGRLMLIRSAIVVHHQRSRQ